MLARLPMDLGPLTLPSREPERKGCQGVPPPLLHHPPPSSLHPVALLPYSTHAVLPPRGVAPTGVALGSSLRCCRGREAPTHNACTIVDHSLPPSNKATSPGFPWAWEWGGGGSVPGWLCTRALCPWRHAPIGRPPSSALMPSSGKSEGPGRHSMTHVSTRSHTGAYRDPTSPHWPAAPSSVDLRHVGDNDEEPSNYRVQGRANALLLLV